MAARPFTLWRRKRKRGQDEARFLFGGDARIDSRGLGLTVECSTQVAISFRPRTHGMSPEL